MEEPRSHYTNDKDPPIVNLESAIESLEASVTPVKGAKHSFHLDRGEEAKRRFTSQRI
jgi:hypothetical protein